MMKKRIGFPLAILMTFVLSGATCIVVTGQRSPKGPWLGEVRNNSGYTIKGAFIGAVVRDANGFQIGGYHSVPICPGYLRPGERGTFEVFSQAPDDAPGPFTVETVSRILGPTNPAEGPAAFSGDGIEVRELATDPTRGLVVAEVANTTDDWVGLVEICANLRANDGKLLAVGSVHPHHPNSLPIVSMTPGEHRVFSLFFDSMPPGKIEFVPRRALRTRSMTTLDPARFHPTVVKEQVGPFGPVLKVVGEVSQTQFADPDMGGLRLSAHIEGRLLERVDGAEAGCGSGIDAESPAPVAFTIPLSNPVGTDRVVIEAILATPNQGFHRLNVVATTSSLESGRLQPVGVRLENAEDFGMKIRGVCFNLRDKHGKLVGTTSFGDHRYIGPHEFTDIDAEVEALEPASTVEVIALGTRSSPPR